jgi:hypothetical protein
MNGFQTYHLKLCAFSRHNYNHRYLQTVRLCHLSTPGLHRRRMCCHQCPWRRWEACCGRWHGSWEMVWRRELCTSRSRLSTIPKLISAHTSSEYFTINCTKDTMLQPIGWTGPQRSDLPCHQTFIGIYKEIIITSGLMKTEIMRLHLTFVIIFKSILKMSFELSSTTVETSDRTEPNNSQRITN